MAIYSFEPIADDECGLLILGTMPGVVSLRKQQYYGNAQNAFWRVLYGLFGLKPDEDYDMRKKFLLEQHIALWDVLKACEREGSSDGDIKNPVPNDFAAFYTRYPQIRSVCFNGGPAGRLYKRFVEKPGLAEDSPRSFYSFPSTSPAYTIPFEKKLEQWKFLLQII